MKQVRGIDRFGPNSGILLNLARTELVEVDPSPWFVKRADLAAAIARLATAEPEEKVTVMLWLRQEQLDARPKVYGPITVENRCDGGLAIGCQLFSPEDAAAIKTWAKTWGAAPQSSTTRARYNVAHGERGKALRKVRNVQGKRTRSAARRKVAKSVRAVSRNLVRPRGKRT